MKKLYLAIMMVLCLFFASVVTAQPFLVCDAPDSAEEVTGYVLTFNGGENIETPAPLHYDLAGLLDGTYTVAACAKNMWGVSDLSYLDFTKSLPSSPGDVKISMD